MVRIDVLVLIEICFLIAALVYNNVEAECFFSKLNLQH